MAGRKNFNQDESGASREEMKKDFGPRAISGNDCSGFWLENRGAALLEASRRGLGHGSDPDKHELRTIPRAVAKENKGSQIYGLDFAARDFVGPPTVSPRSLPRTSLPAPTSRQGPHPWSRSRSSCCAAAKK